MTEKNAVSCKRPYELGLRLEQSDLKRTRILAAARAHLEARGFQELTMELLARKSGVSRQTIHNLFGTKTGVLEALFDQLAMDAGMMRMREVMQARDHAAMLSGFVEVFTGFWARDRMLLRRIHGIAAIDPEFGAAVEARNRRRLTAATRIVDVICGPGGALDAQRRAQRIAKLYALTSFEYFDAMAESLGSPLEIQAAILMQSKNALEQD